MKAIVYTSNTGTTKEYSKLLGDKLSLSVYSLDEAKGKVELGNVRAVCAVGMGATGTQVEEVRTKNEISNSTPKYLCQEVYSN